MADSRRGPAPPPRPGQGPRDSGGRPDRANRRLATVLGGGVLAVALGAVAWAGLSGSGNSTPTTDAGTNAGSSTVIGPSIPKASAPTTVKPVGPAIATKASPKPATASVPASTVPLPVATKAAVTVAKTVAKPLAKPVAKPVVKPAAKPVLKSVAKPVVASGSSVGHVATSSIRYRVASGDSLWSLTERSLAATGRSTSVGNVSAFLTRFYASNGTTVGSDPNVIIPGQVITWPVGL